VNLANDVAGKIIMRAMNIDPTYLPYLEKAIADRSEALDLVDVATRREKVAKARAENPPIVPDGVTVESITISSDGLPLRLLVFRPTAAVGLLPVILYCHGGGWMYGSPEQSSELAYLYVKEVGAIVVSPEYRLSPEHPFPAGFNDCYAALTWLAEQGSANGIDTSRIAVAGESSGGNLAAACAIAARDRRGPQILLQLLNYPAMGLNFQTLSYVENSDAPILSGREMRYFWKNYLAGMDVSPDACAVPLAAVELGGLPAAHIITAEYDPLRDDGRDYAARLQRAGTGVVVRNAERLTHGFFRALSSSEDVKKMANFACEALRLALFGVVDKQRKSKWI
jgi:acetyl esterase